MKIGEKKVDEVREYVKELGRVLRTFDPSEMRKFIEEHRYLYGKGYPELFLQNDDYFIRGMMAKMVMNRKDMSFNDRNKARAILQEMDWSESIL